MPPFAATPTTRLQINTHPPPADDELESPIESFAKLNIEEEMGDVVEALPPPKFLKLVRPELTARSSTDPSPASLLQGYFSNTHQRPSSSHRNRSPYSRSHLRSRSSASALLTAPVMTRAHSLPNPHLPRTPETTVPGTPTSGSLSPGSHSPMKSPARVRSPFKQEDGPAPRSPSYASGGAIESIQEDSELDLTPRSTPVTVNTMPQPTAMASFSRSGSLRRRPASPLHSLTNAPTHQPTSFPAIITESNVTAASSGSSSPSLGPQRPERYNEAYPSLHHYASTSSFSSMPSTPTSARSRSPSISSLDTIEDTPDLESEAIEDERIERLKLAAERQERIERGEDVDGEEAETVGGLTRRGSLDGPRSGFGRVGRERKRWSVCGGERRADLDLETIWED
ncbi:hypothetical protein BAUCODRAFT_31249 [Baudoinia panamericana UAMH 10762]|uniref:Basic proline-rich protein n=1 Tax=Baudoinia panamericana (strain UAMH 10762) TaxID=717646 RepID=M2NIR1_BAUPA|nr:uncharacterized protein BAUCODRAFT_31249 [Baudoinia panamericana UAMH 10762]EMC98980.1 hypothetical protein BAUCODRAFT_31249 [Baudoinia panamericana UAMH 10762]